MVLDALHILRVTMFTVQVLICFFILLKVKDNWFHFASSQKAFLSGVFVWSLVAAERQFARLLSEVPLDIYNFTFFLGSFFVLYGISIKTDPRIQKNGDSTSLTKEEVEIYRKVIESLEKSKENRDKIV